MTEPVPYSFIHHFNATQSIVHDIAREKGWWDTRRSDGELIALMHSELSEGLEALREDKTVSEHIPKFSGIEEELADVVIRIMDYSEERRLRLAEAIVAKIAYNCTRPHKHGGKKF